MAAKHDKTISTQEYDSQRDLDIAEWEEYLKMPQQLFHRFRVLFSDSEAGSRNQRCTGLLSGKMRFIHLFPKLHLLKNHN